jgi:hypothetical protein
MGARKAVLCRKQWIKIRARRFPCMRITDQQCRTAHSRLRKQGRNLPKQVMTDVNIHNLSTVPLPVSDKVESKNILRSLPHLHAMVGWL